MQRDWSTRIYDRGGNLIQILALEDGIRREFTAYEAIPPDAVRIFLAAEDKDFFSHRGIDIAAIARAAYQNISSGKRGSGASTLTTVSTKTGTRTNAAPAIAAIDRMKVKAISEILRTNAGEVFFPARRKTIVWIVPESKKTDRKNDVIFTVFTTKSMFSSKSP